DVTTREELLAELEKVEQDLADLEEERRAFLGQTGVHIGVGLLKSRRRQYEREEEQLRSRIAALRARLRE
ncbi:MAG: hypothetical protein Q8O76_07450, partial [Chloroflexota bacterium]|nr:hypothetical protein [Chloroflexota bacterium]